MKHPSYRYTKLTHYHYTFRYKIYFSIFRQDCILVGIFLGPLQFSEVWVKREIYFSRNLSVKYLWTEEYLVNRYVQRRTQSGRGEHLRRRFLKIEKKKHLNALFIKPDFHCMKEIWELSNIHSQNERALVIFFLNDGGSFGWIMKWALEILKKPI